MKYKKKELHNIKIRKIIINIIILFLILFSIVKFFFIPQINVTSPKKVELNGNYTPEYHASNFFNDYTKFVKVKNSVNINKEGHYEVIYTLKYLNFTIKEKEIINVEYKGIPTLTLKGKTNLNLCPNEKYKEEGYIAYDDYYGDITNKVKIFYNKNSITYSVKNRNDKEIIKIRKINYIDNEKPEIKLNSSSTINLVQGTIYEEPGYIVTDNCDTDFKLKVKISGEVDEKTIGTYTITYEVTDTRGNTSITTRTINIIPKSTNKSIIYLTFDDGPSRTSTPRILDILKEERVPATFFVTNKNNTLNYLLIREKEEGHTIGLHTASHNYIEIYSSEEAYFKDLKLIHDKVYKITGIDSKIIRFPGGTSNTISKKYNPGIMSKIVPKVLADGYHYFDWNIDSEDAGRAKTKEDIYNNVINNLKPNQSNIILMHDFDNNYKTIDALKDIIDYGKINGYSFEKLTSTSEEIRHKIQN